MKKLLAILFFLSVAIMGAAQGIYFEPEPTNIFEPSRLYINITSSDCSCPELQDADPESNPLYIWAWDPNEERPDINGVNIKNGEWGNSNPNMKMKRDESNPNLWYFDFYNFPMVQFYNVPASTIYADGIQFLVKEKNGAPPDVPEQKSPNLSAVPEAPGCLDKLCLFPTVYFQDDYLTLTYNNNIETIGSLLNIPEDQAYIWFQYKINGGSFQVARAQSEKFRLKADGGGFFSLTLVPKDFFELEDGDILTSVNAFITKPPVQAPPFSGPIPMDPGCQ